MRSSITLLSSILLGFSSLSSAHFALRYPKSIGFDEDTEPNGPCGGFTPDLSKAVDFHVGGDSIAWQLAHPQGNFLIRVTLDSKAESGWEQVFPIVQQSGLGNFCEKDFTLPSKYAGQKGVIGIVCDAPDGLLFQCIAANFVSGSTSTSSQCTNSSVTASFVNDSKLTALVGASSSNNTSSSPSSSSGSSSNTATGSSAAATSTNAAASLHGSWSAGGVSFGNMMAVLSMAMVGGALMI